MSQCSDPRMADLLGAYALGACPPGEADQVRDHLPGCASCTHALLELAGAREALLTAVPPAQPMPDLKARIMRDVRADADLFAAAQEREHGRGRAADAPSSDGFWGRLRERLSSPIPLATALACGLALALGAGVLAATLAGGDSSPSSPSRTVLGQVDASQAKGASAKIVEQDGQARIVLDGMPDPGRGRVYEVWLQSGAGAPRPTRGLFSVGSDGSGEAAVPSGLKGVDKVLVTSEPSGGSQQPTRDPVVVVQV